MKFNKILKEVRMSSVSSEEAKSIKPFGSYPKNLNPWDSGITDRGWTGLSSDIRVLTYKERFGNNPKEQYGAGDEKVSTISDNEWKRNKNKLDKMDWEQPEPNPSDFASSDVQDIANQEMSRLDHNKSSYKQAYKKHEVPDDKSMARLVKMDDKESGDPLLWKNFKSMFSPNDKGKY